MVVDKFIGHFTKVPDFHETHSEIDTKATEAAKKVVSSDIRIYNW